MTTKAELFQVEGQHTGLLVAVWLDPALAAVLAIEGGEPADQLHLTLCYCGDANEMSDVQIGRAIAAVNETAMIFGPLTGQIAGLGRFNASASSDAKDVIYANVDVPGLAEMRNYLASSLEFADCPPLRNHGYTPHITLAYVEPGAEWPIDRIDSQPFVIRSIWVGVGDRRTEIPLTGTAKSAKRAEVKEMSKLTKTLDISKDADGWIVASTPAVDRDRDRIMPLGGDLTNFQKNPVLIFGHNYYEPWAVIGRVAEWQIDAAGIRMLPQLREPANESDPMHIIRALWDQNLLRTSSIGFIPIESRENEFGGRDFLKWELLELSLVPVPANQEAIRMAVKALTTPANEPHTEPDTTHRATAPIADPPQLTPEQEAELATALAALTDELTDLFTEE